MLCNDGVSATHLGVKGDVSSLAEHARMVRQSFEEKVIVIPSTQLQEFLKAYLETEQASSRQPRYMAQRFFGDYSRSPSDSSPKSDWYRRMIGRGYTPAAITEISRLRQRIQGRSREKVDHSTFKQISSKKVVDLWAQEGTRPGLSESETPQERLRRIDQILALMKKSSFEIAFVDGETAKHLGWNEEEAGNEFSFVVQGDDAIVVEMSVASIARDGDRFADIYGIIRDEVVVARMRKDFEKVWEMLPAFVKDRENTMRYLGSLRAIIQQKMA